LISFFRRRKLSGGKEEGGKKGREGKTISLYFIAGLRYFRTSSGGREKKGGREGGREMNSR